jgi:TRAP-type C4-dicarboxylate transport system permease small subunit
MGFWTNKNSGEYVGKRTKKQEIAGLIICILFVCLFAWLGLKAWTDFVEMEEGKKDLTVDTFSYILYKLGGKYLATSIWVLLTAFFAFMGYKRWKGYKNAAE